MNGKIVQGAAKLDYRAVARPLSFKMLSEDVDELYKNDTTVEEIILWEHQVDWLVKAERAGLPLENARDRRAPSPLGVLTTAVFPKAYIWGIPVDIVEPLKVRDLMEAAKAAYENA